MPYDPPDRDELREMVLADSRARLPEMDTSEGSPEYHLHTVPSTAALAAVGNAKGLHRAIMAQYAKLDDLSNLASLWGLSRHPAVGAAGGILTVGVTTATGAWLITQQFRSADGLTYVATSAGSWSGSPSTVEIPFEAVDTGAATTKAVGSIFTVLTPPAGMNATGYIDTGDGFTTLGRDIETDEELRERMVNLFMGTANSGNRGDYVRWMEEVDGVAEGFAYTAQRNDLSVDGTVFGPASTPGSRWVGAATITAVEDYINGTATTDGQRAVGQDFDGVAPTAQAQAVLVTLDTNAGYGRDWGSAAGSSLVIDSIDTTQMIISVTTNPSGFGSPAANLAVGDQIAVNTQITGAYYHCDVRTVTNITGAGPTWYITVSEAFSSRITTGAVYPAGPTTAGTVTAIEAGFDALGPADTSPATRWPLVSSEKPCDLNLAELNRRIMDVEVDGIRRHLNTTWTTPGADVTATTSAVAGGVLVANCIRLTTCRIQYNQLNS